MLDNGFELKLHFNPLIKYFDIKPVLATIKNPQSNAPVERVHQVILNMLVTKDLANKFLIIYSMGYEGLLSLLYPGHTMIICL